MGGLAGSKASKSRGGFGPQGGAMMLPRPNSLGDFNEAEEEGWNIGQMSDNDILNVSIKKIIFITHKPCFFYTRLR